MKIKLLMFTVVLFCLGIVAFASPPAVNSGYNINAESAGNLPSVALVITEVQSDNTAIIAEAPTIVSNENQTMAAATNSNITNPVLDSNNINEEAITAEQTSSSLIANANGTNNAVS